MFAAVQRERAVVPTASPTNHNSADTTLRWQFESKEAVHSFVPKFGVDAARYQGSRTEENVSPQTVCAWNLFLQAETLRPCQEQFYAAPFKTRDGKTLKVDARLAKTPDDFAKNVTVSLENRDRLVVPFYQTGANFHATPVLFHDKTGAPKILAQNMAGTTTGLEQDEQQKLAMATNKVGPVFVQIPKYNKETQMLLAATNLKSGPLIGASGYATAAGLMNMHRKLYCPDIASPTLGLAPASANPAAMQAMVDNKDAGDSEKPITKMQRDARVIKINLGLADHDQASPEVKQAFSEPHMIGLELHNGRNAKGQKQAGLSDITGDFQTDVVMPDLKASIAQRAIGAPHLGVAMVQSNIFPEMEECIGSKAVNLATGEPILTEMKVPILSDKERKANNTATRKDDLHIHPLRPENLHIYVTWLMNALEGQENLIRAHPDYNEMVTEQATA